MKTYPHIPVEVLLAEIKEKNNPGQPKDVIILGAGIAGLTAGYELKQLGHKVRIFEAQNRVGGRIYTHRFPEDPEKLYGEMGAMRIPGSHDYPRYYIKQMGLEMRKFVTVFENDNAFLDLRNHICRIKDGKKMVSDLYKITNWEKNQYPQSQILGLALDQIYGKLTDEQVVKLFNGQLDEPILEEIAYMSLGELLEECSVGKDAYELIGNLSGEIGMADVCMIKYLRDNIEGADDGLEEIVGGMDLLPVKLAEHLEDEIELNTVVKGIDSTGDGVVVTVQDSNGNIHEIHGGYVICTIPFTVLRRLELNLKDPSKAFAINTLKYASMTKVILNCRERFWETKYGIFGGASVSDQITRWTYYPSDHADSMAEIRNSGKRIYGVSGTAFQLGQINPPKDESIIGGPGVLLSAYVQGEDAIRLGAISDEEIVNVVKEKISRFHPEILEEGMVTDSFVMAWDRFPWSAGALSYPWPGQALTLFDDIVDPDGSLYFAGEHCATERPWIQAAQRSALMSVLDIVSRG